MAAVAVVLGFAASRLPWRLTLVGAGLLGLFGTASVSSALAAVGGVAVLSVAPRIAVGLRRTSPMTLAWFAFLTALVVPILRPDSAASVAAHLFQAERFWASEVAGNPLFGSGWSNVDVALFYNSDVKGLHNVYLDVVSFLGLVGAALFLALLVTLARRGDGLTRALIVVVLVWMNTTGAFPGVGWGVLGLMVAAVAASSGDAAQGEELVRPAADGPGADGRMSRVPWNFGGAGIHRARIGRAAAGGLALLPLTERFTIITAVRRSLEPSCR